MSKEPSTPTSLTPSSTKLGLSKWKRSTLSSVSSAEADLKRQEEQAELERKKKAEKDAAVHKVMTQTLTMSSEEFGKFYTAQ